MSELQKVINKRIQESNAAVKLGDAAKEATKQLNAFNEACLDYAMVDEDWEEVEEIKELEG
jgi:hypothetical protein